MPPRRTPRPQLPAYRQRLRPAVLFPPAAECLLSQSRGSWSSAPFAAPCWKYPDRGSSCSFSRGPPGHPDRYSRRHSPPAHRSSPPDCSPAPCWNSTPWKASGTYPRPFSGSVSAAGTAGCTGQGPARPASAGKAPPCHSSAVPSDIFYTPDGLQGSAGPSGHSATAARKAAVFQAPQARLP